MKLKEEDEVYFLYRIRYANDESTAVEFAHSNTTYCSGLEMSNFESYSLYDVFYEHYHLDLTWTRDDIRADSIRVRGCTYSSAGEIRTGFDCV